jgi:two-component system, NarL family, invasion response regulator UvrY
MSEQKIKVCIADDHLLFRKGLSELISDFGNVELLFDAANGEELLEKLKTAKVLPDICILDINMPGMNGFDTAKAIKKKWPKMKMLALSMSDSELSIIRMLRAGANGYVLKDVEPSELKRAITTIYTTGFYHSEIITGRLLRMSQELTVEEQEEQSLSDKEIQFLELACSELTYKDIAEKMGHSPRTIDGYRDNLFIKLNIKSRTGLVMYAIRKGLVTLE